MHFDLMSPDLVSQGIFQFALQAFDVHAFATSPGQIPVQNPHQLMGIEVRLHLPRGRRFNAKHGPLSAAGKHPQLLKGSVDGGGDLNDFLVIHLGGGVKDYKECKEQGDKVSIGDKPPLVADMGMPFPSSAHAGCVSCGLCSNKYPSSLVSRMRGFMPSRIEMTPSMVISRRICSSRPLIFSLPEEGRKNRLAEPTP